MGMTESGVGHERPLGISRPLIIGLGVAVAFAAFMAGWFILTVLSGDIASAEVATPANDTPAMSTAINVPDPASAPATTPLGNDHVLAWDIDSGLPAFAPMPTPRPRRSVPFPRPRPQMEAEQGQNAVTTRDSRSDNLFGIMLAKTLLSAP
jgi:hypothetical protein